MTAILAFLSGGIAPLVAVFLAACGIIGAVLGIRRAGVKAGRAEAQAAGTAHVEKSADQQNKIRSDSNGLSGDDARKRLRDNWSRP
jgi:hypothetical protein